MRQVSTVPHQEWIDNVMSQDWQLSNYPTYYIAGSVEQALLGRFLLDVHNLGYHYTIKQLCNEVFENKLRFVPMKLKVCDAILGLTGHKVPQLKKSQYNANLELWETEYGSLISQIAETRPIETNHPLYNDYKNTNFVQDVNSLDLYNPQTLEVVKQLDQLINSFGYNVLSYPKKSAYQQEIATNRAPKNQTLRLSQIMTSRNTKEKIALTTTEFLGFIVNTTSPKNIRVAERTYDPVHIADKNHNQKQIIKYGKTRDGYELKARQLIIDVDNGAQIDAILNLFISGKCPIIPQMCVIEKGIGVTKKGNASFIVMFDEPLDGHERKQITRAIKYYIAHELDIYAIDSNCTGIGFFKNPCTLVGDELRRETLFRFNDSNSFDSVSKKVTLAWADKVEEEYSNCLPDNLEQFIVTKQLKYSNSTLTEISEKYADELAQMVINKPSSKLWQDVVHEGERNDILIKEESTLVLCAEMMSASGTLNALDAPKTMTNMFGDYIRSRYDNHDYQMTDNYIRSRFKWCIEKDNRIITNGNENDRKSYANAYMAIRNSMMNNPSSIPFLEYFCEANNLPVPTNREQVRAMLKDIPEFVKNLAQYDANPRYSYRSKQESTISNQIKRLTIAISQCSASFEEIIEAAASVNSQGTISSRYKQFCKKIDVNYAKKDNRIIWLFATLASECNSSKISNKRNKDNTFVGTLTSYIDLFAGINNFHGSDAANTIAYWTKQLLEGIFNLIKSLNSDNITYDSLNGIKMNFVKDMIYDDWGYCDTIRNFLYVLTNKEDSETIYTAIENKRSNEVSALIAKFFQNHVMNNLATALVSQNIRTLIDNDVNIPDKLYYEAVNGYDSEELDKAIYSISRSFCNHTKKMTKSAWNKLKSELKEVFKNNEYAQLLEKVYDGMSIDEIAEMLLNELAKTIVTTDNITLRNLYSEIIDEIAAEAGIDHTEIYDSENAAVFVA